MDSHGKPKMVILLRKDLGLSTGRACAQVAHIAQQAIMKAYELPVTWGKEQIDWIRSQTIAVLAVADENEMFIIAEKAVTAGMLIAGFAEDSYSDLGEGEIKTGMSLGPHYSDRFTGVTDHLELYT